MGDDGDEWNAATFEGAIEAAKKEFLSDCSDTCSGTNDDVTVRLNYKDLVEVLSKGKGSDLSQEERRLVSFQVRSHNVQVKRWQVHRERQAHRSQTARGNFLVITSYTNDDYYKPLGDYCAQQNRLYCERHNYHFQATVLPKDEMLQEIAPRDFGSYHKIKLLRGALQNNDLYLQQHNIEYLVWMDADACVIEPQQTLQDIVQQANNTDLIIAEDQTPSCLINCGVMIFRVCAWSTQLLQAVWEEPKFHQKRHYEQSALQKVLAQQGEGLELHQPNFHTYTSHNNNNNNNNYQWKHFPHVCVLPRSQLNTRIMDHDDNNNADTNESAKFIFHPAGLPHKLEKIQYMVQQRQQQQQQQDAS
ncbi:expressed unknown protein [Seminavis robusta]|uniref:Uncharacterized protein n=1 Tax=Seminavis robusta TaxID=568900 RepID=A0A9N8DDM5_9STRA|nr:expressed unknown protein [Seminavis robusta]|eukprot:Sro93_g048690.1 n/a (360) ;mRNA; r:107141-108220